MIKKILAMLAIAATSFATYPSAAHADAYTKTCREWLGEDVHVEDIYHCQRVRARNTCTWRIRDLHIKVYEALPGWKIKCVTKHDWRNGNNYGITYPAPFKEIQVMVEENDSAKWTRHVLAHEIGHALDFEYMNDAERNHYRHRRKGWGNLHLSGFWAKKDANGFSYQEDFGDTVAMLLTNRRDWNSGWHRGSRHWKYSPNASMDCRQARVAQSFAHINQYAKASFVGC